MADELFILLDAPVNSGGFTAEGIPYKVDGNNQVNVPARLIDVAKSHGFTEPAPVVDSPAPKFKIKLAKSPISGDDTGN